MNQLIALRIYLKSSINISLKRIMKLTKEQKTVNLQGENSQLVLILSNSKSLNRKMQE